MTDTKLITSAFALCDQPVVISKKNLIFFMNTAAVTLAERDLTGKPSSLLFPAHIEGNQAESFVTTAFIGNRSCVVKVTSAEGYKIYALNPQVYDLDTSAMFFSNMRSTLMDIMLGARQVSSHAEKTGSRELMAHAASISRNYYRLKRAVDNITTVSLIQQNELPFNPEPIDMADLCRNLIDTVRYMMNGRYVNITFNSEDHINIVADRCLTEQLLLNLLSNSIAHCDNECHIGISLLRTDSNLIISVNDDGEGISPEELSIVFERYRHEINFTESTMGSGLGLAVVRAIAEKHGGTVIVESRGRGCGTSVRVMLSLDIPPKRPIASAAAPYEDSNLHRILTELSNVLPEECYSDAMLEQ